MTVISVVNGTPIINTVTSGTGPAGAPGADGADGIDGIDGGSETHDFTGSPATLHQITHALSYLPNVAVTVAGVTVIAQVEYVNATRIDIRTASASEPIVYLS